MKLWENEAGMRMSDGRPASHTGDMDSDWIVLALVVEKMGLLVEVMNKKSRAISCRRMLEATGIERNGAPHYKGTIKRLGEVFDTAGWLNKVNGLNRMYVNLNLRLMEPTGDVDAVTEVNLENLKDVPIAIRQNATILAALSFWKKNGMHVGSVEYKIATDCGQYPPLSISEIDSLIEDVNNSSRKDKRFDF